MQHKIFVITKEKRDEANAYFNSIGIEGNTFTVPLFKNGVHTHYWCGFYPTKEQLNEILKKYTDVFDDGHDALNTLGLQVKESGD